MPLPTLPNIIELPPLTPGERQIAAQIIRAERMSWTPNDKLQRAKDARHARQIGAITPNQITCGAAKIRARWDEVTVAQRSVANDHAPYEIPVVSCVKANHRIIRDRKR